MQFRRRSVYDLNDFRCDCRVVEEPVLDTAKRPDGSIVSQVTLECITNSNPYSSRVAAHFYLIDYGKRAERIAAMIHKGYGIWVSAELVDKKEVIVNRTLKTTRRTIYSAFKVNRIVVISIPDRYFEEGSEKIVSEETSMELFPDAEPIPNISIDLDSPPLTDIPL